MIGALPREGRHVGQTSRTSREDRSFASYADAGVPSPLFGAAGFLLLQFDGWFRFKSIRI